MNRAREVRRGDGNGGTRDNREEDHKEEEGKEEEIDIKTEEMKKDKEVDEMQ